jgi:hypothetical protein
MTEIIPPVLKAIGEIRLSCPECAVEVDPDGNGGAFVVTRDIRLGSPYVQERTWIGFQITFQYPYADVYPHFTQPDLARLDRKPLGEGFGTAQFRGSAAIQISRRSNKLNPATDTASLKLLKVHQWLLTRP